jgi:MarR family transcriptional regulator, transcriptional regulator for hemolysin
MPTVTRHRTRSPAVAAWLHLGRVFVRTDRRAEQTLRAFGLTHPQFGVLARLREREGLTQQDLSEGLLLDKSNLCRILTLLEGAGLLERKPDGEDRRANRILLTARGRRVLDQAIPALDTMLEEQFRGLDREGQRTLSTLLRRIERGALESEASSSTAP